MSSTAVGACLNNPLASFAKQVRNESTVFFPPPGLEVHSSFPAHAPSEESVELQRQGTTAGATACTLGS